jgi:hypothetical protein
VPIGTDHLRPNEGEVAAKVMDGEAIMINLSNGMYYSMDGVGGLIWSLIDDGYNLEQVASAVARRYEVDLAVARADVERLAAELLEEKLVFVAEGPPTSARNGNEAAAAGPGAKLPYVPPLLNAYRDLGALLALDPPMPGLQDVPWEGAQVERTS